MRGVRLDDLVEQLRAEVGHSTNPAVSINGRDYLVQVLKRTQERLWEEYDWPWFKVSRDLLIEKGQRYYSVPNDLAYERIIDVSFKYGSAWHCLSHGIDERQYSTYDSDRDARSWPLVAWDVAEDTGVVDDIGLIELWPVPSRSSNNNDGQVRLTGFRKLKQFKDGNDKCELDGTLIVLMAASEIQARQNQSDAALKLQQATALLSRLQNQNSNKDKFTSFSMGCDDDVNGFRPREVTSVTSLGGGGGSGGGGDCGDYVPLGGTELSSPITGELRFSTDGTKDWKLTQISNLFGGNAITFAATGASSGMYVATIDVDGNQSNFAFEPDGDFTVPRTLTAAGVVATEGGLGAVNLNPVGRSLEVGDFGIIVPSEYDADKVVVEDEEGDVQITRTLSAEGLFATGGGVGAANLPTKGKLLEVGDYGIITQSAFSADDLTGGGGDGPLPVGSVKDTLVCAGNDLWVATSLMQVDEADTKVTVNGEIVADGIISTAGIGSMVFTDTGRNIEVGPFGILQQSTFDAADIITKDEDGDVVIPRTLSAAGLFATSGGVGAANLTPAGQALQVGAFGIIEPASYAANKVVFEDADGDVQIERTLTAAGLFATDGGVGAANLTDNGRLLEVGNFGIVTQSSKTTGDFVPTSRTISTTGANSGLSGGGNLSQNRSLSVDDTVLRTSGNQTTSGSLTAAGYAAVGGSFGSTLFANKGRLLQVGDLGIIEQATVTAADLDGVPTSRTISSGTGLSGGGNLSANRTLSVDSTVLRTNVGDQTTSGALTATGFAATTGSFGSVQFTTKGRLLQVGDLGIIEQATVSASDIGGVPTSRTLTAGDGLSGGGNLTANRSFAVDSSVVRTSRSVATGDGLSGGGNLSANRTLTVDSTVIRTSGTQTFTGTKTFSQTTEFQKNITNSGMQAGAGPTLVNAFSVIGYSSSDRRLKKDIVDGVMGIETIMQMRPVEFTWNDKTMMPGMKDIGFIAQEQQEISEHLVSDTMEWLTLRSDNLNPILVKALQQQQEVIENLTARIEQLEAAGIA